MNPQCGIVSTNLHYHDGMPRQITRIIITIVFICLVTGPAGTLGIFGGTSDGIGEGIEGPGDTDLPEVSELIPSRMNGWFTCNQGQIEDPEVLFTYAGSGFSATFMEGGYGMRVRGVDNRSVNVMVGFGEARPVKPEGRGTLSHRSNFFLGADPSRWCTGVPNYRSVVYPGLYEGVDLAFHPSEDGLKYEFIVHPGARVDDISLLYQGADALLLDANGDLRIVMPYTELIEHAPYSYQLNSAPGSLCVGQVPTYFPEQGDENLEIPSRFEVEGNRVRFRIGDYDPTRLLVIDPLIFSTYLGGSESDNALDLLLEPDGNILLTGDSYSTDFPTTEGVYDNDNNGDRDIFIFRMSPDGSEMLCSTLIGGGGQDVAHGIAIDDDGNIYVAGRTDSVDFPTTAGAYDETHNGENDVVVFKMNGQCTELLYSTFVGGGNYEVGYAGVVVDDSGSAFVAGHTNSLDFPTTPDAYDRSYYAAGWDGFAFKLEPDGSDLAYSSYFGGWDYEGARDIMVDGAGNAYLTGDTTSVDFPTTSGVYDETYNGERDGFVLVFNQDGSDLVFSTFLGGSDNDIPNAILSGEGDTLWLTGTSYSVDYPTTSDAYDDSNNGERDFFISRLTNDGTELRYSTLIGGGDTDEAYALAPEGDVVHVGGRTGSDDFPVTWDALSLENAGNLDGVVLTLDTALAGEEQLRYSTYLGGAENEAVWSLKLRGGDLYCTGLSSSTDFPTTAGAFQTEYNGGFIDAVVFRMGSSDGNIGPQAVISTPSNGSEVSGTVAIRGTAAVKDGEVVMVEISIDGGEWIRVNGTETWTFDWDSRTVGDGVHSISARSHDGDEYSDEASVTITVHNDKDKDGDDEWYEEPVYIGGLTSIIIVIVVVVAALFFRKRNAEDYQDLGDDEDSDEEW